MSIKQASRYSGVKVFLFSLLPAFVMLVLGESALRLFSYPPVPQLSGGFNLHVSISENDSLVADPELLWLGKPFYHNGRVKHNAEGFRSPVPKAEKSADTVRFVFFGDSVTYGYGCTASSYVDQVRESLPASNIEVLNYSVCGYTSLQGRLLFDRLGKALSPDIVFISYLWNDSFPAPPRWMPPYGLAKYFRLVYLGRYIKYLMQTKGSSPAGEENSNTVSLDDYRTNIQKMVSMARDCGARPFLILHTYDPHPLGHLQYILRPIDDVNYSRYADVLREISQHEDVGLVDLNRSLHPLIDDEWPLFIPDGFHTTALCNRLIAREIVENLSKEGIVEPADADTFLLKTEDAVESLLQLADCTISINTELAAYYYWEVLRWAPENKFAWQRLQELKPGIPKPGPK